MLTCTGLYIQSHQEVGTQREQNSAGLGCCFRHTLGESQNTAPPKGATDINGYHHSNVGQSCHNEMLGNAMALATQTSFSETACK